MKQKTKIITGKLFNHLHKVKRRHVEKFIHTWTHTHHAMIHVGELLVVGMIGFSSLLFANYNNSYEHLHRNSTQEIVQSLSTAIQEQKPKVDESKIISVWEMDGNVNNTFAPGYCTYGAARISPEFFPYSEDNMNQERTRGGNAIDRCENAEKAGFKIGSTPSVGALIVYNKVGNNVTFGHVGKVMFYNKKYQSLIIRDMNWLGKFIMTDRWENADNQNVKCYIYPGKVTTTDTTSSDLPQNNDKFNTNSGTVTTGTTLPEKDTTTPSTPVINEENKPDTNTDNSSHNSAPIENNNQEKENSPIYDQQNNSSEEEITIDENNQNFSDITKHFFSQYTMKIKVIKKNSLTIGDKVTVEIAIINKETNEPYQGILPFVFNSISKNTILEGNLNTIQLMHTNENRVYFTAKEKGESAILLTIDDEKIVTMPIAVN